MIEIKEKQDCCGCGACVQKCPVNCISFSADKEGFQYPVADPNICIGCGLCEKVCPEINDYPVQQPIQTLAVVNVNKDVLRESSSGGAFTFLAMKVLDDGGVVFGAAFDIDWSVHHIAVTRKDDLQKLRGSKYLQSRIENSYVEAEKFLKSGRKVMFTGTSCQIKGLQLFLRKRYENLLAVECLCHGVPSPLVWQKYLKQTIGNKKIKGVSFRDKRTGWENYSLSIQYDGGEFSELGCCNIYMKGFLSNLYLRPSCESCPAKNGRSRSDVLLADYWGARILHPEYYDEEGTGLAIPFTSKGMSMLQGLPSHAIELEDAKRYNAGFADGAKSHKRRKFFFKSFETEPIALLIKKSLRGSILSRIKSKIRRFISRIS